MRGALAGQVGEAHDVAEEDADADEALGLWDFALLHLMDDLAWEKVGQEFLRLPLLLAVGLNAFVVDLRESACKDLTCCFL